MNKFDSVRDEHLYTMSLQAWATKSDGNVEAPTGFFALIINAPDDMFEIRQAFDIDSYKELDSLIGNFILIEDNQGFVHVDSYSSDYEANKAYDELNEQYSEWLGPDDNE